MHLPATRSQDGGIWCIYLKNLEMSPLSTDAGKSKGGSQELDVAFLSGGVFKVPCQLRNSSIDSPNTKNEIPVQVSQ